MHEILQNKLAKRDIDNRCLEFGDIVEKQQTGTTNDSNKKRGSIGILARKIVKMTKDSKLKVQASIQGDQVRINGKKTR